MRYTTIPLRDRNETRSQNARIGFDGDHDFRTVIERGYVDFLIISAELGFSPLGANHELISEGLGIDSATILELAQMVQEDPLRASMVCLTNQIPNGGGLRGVMLVSSENSRYYREQLAEAKNPNRIRDFYFALTHESLVLASNEVKATKFGMTHISAGGDIQPKILKHSIDAYIQFAYKSQARSREFSFVGCCIDWSIVEQAASMADTEFRGPHLHAAYFENNDIDGFRRVTAKIL